MPRPWPNNLEDYLLNTKEIDSLIQFLASRHDLQKNDLQMAEWINFNNLPYFGLCVKVDEISKNLIQKTTASFSKQLKTDVFPFSKMTNRYNDAVLNKMDELVKSYK